MPGEQRLAKKVSGKIVSISLLLATGSVAQTWSLETAYAQSESPAATPASRRRLTPRLTPRPSAPPAAKPAKPAPAPQAAPSQSEPAQPVPAAPAPKSSPAASPAPQALPPAAAPVDGGLSFRPPVLLAYKDMDPPPGYYEKKFYNKGLLIGGGVTLGAIYGAGLIYGATQNFEGGLGSLAVPILGPWLALGKRNFVCDTSVDTSSPDPDTLDEATDAAERCQQLLLDETKAAVVLFGLGLGQLAGAVITTVGIADRKTRWLRADIAGLDVRFDPLVSPSMSGFLASGTF